jgi:methanogenic corrinoid protein MtbC1
LHVSRFSASLLRTSARAYARAALHALHESRRDLVETDLPRTFAAPAGDIEVRLLQLAGSLAVDRPVLFADALAWYKVAFHHRGVPADYLSATLQAIESTLADELPAEVFAHVHQHLAAAAHELPRAPVDLPSHLHKEAPHGELAMRYLLANLEGRGDDALELLRAALREGVAVDALHDHVLAPAQLETGRMWLMAEIPIADEHYGTAIAERALAVLHDHVPCAPAGAPRVLTLGVGGDLHQLGLRVVAQRLQGAGFAVQHLGGNMPASDLSWALQDRPVDLIAISATMLLHLQQLIELIETVRTTALRRQRSWRCRVRRTSS